ncbi:ABC transporter permease [Robertkochia marina]|uniref:ABC transporter permease n=2 Tax=Robertkochia marina TaxID=1227945 RepID=A0A4S3LXI9_9FLAO|nr:ABC transporter permease [Robertkochia marina]TRZ46605.1 ABC transporter permease [Robertkochia marina]
MNNAVIRVEWYKLFRQSRTWYALGALLLLQVVLLLNAWYQGASLLDIFLENLKQSFHFQGELLNGHLLVYIVLNTMWFHLPLILMIVVSGMLTSEMEAGTLRTVMMTGISKGRYIRSKFTVAILFTVLVVILVALTSGILSYLIFGVGDLFVFHGALNFFESNDAFLRLFLAFAAGSFSMVFFSVVSMLLAVIFRETVKTWIVAAFFLIVCNLLLQMQLGEGWFRRLFFVNLNDTWQMFFEYTINWSAILWNLIFLAGYILIITAVGIWWFKKTDIE